MLKEINKSVNQLPQAKLFIVPKQIEAAIAASTADPPSLRTKQSASNQSVSENDLTIHGNVGTGFQFRCNCTVHSYDLNRLIFSFHYKVIYKRSMIPF